MLGASYIANAVNTYNGNEISGSQGYTLSGVVGLNLIKGNIGVMVNSNLPLSQNMFQGQTKLQSKISLGLTFSI
jgi:hypothetical protein